MPAGRIPRVALVGLGTASILFDGLSQTRPSFEVFGAPASPVKTAPDRGVPRVIVAGASSSSRLVGVRATAAGADCRSPSGYLVAHYFTYLLVDGQRIVIALADPLQQGWDLGNFGWAFFEPNSTFLPPGFVWTDPARGGRRRARARRVGRPRAGTAGHGGHRRIEAAA